MTSPNPTPIIKAEPSDAGCWINGRWGQFGIARMIEIAADHGYVDTAAEPPFAQLDVVDIARRHLASMNPSTEPITDDEHENLSWTCDDVEAWMNEHVAPAGFSFSWEDGEFFLRAPESTFWDLLESPPKGCENVAALWSWSLNYDAGRGPATLFLDLIGYSQDEYGSALYSLEEASLRHLELTYLRDALSDHLADPHGVLTFVSTLLAAESDR